MSGLTPFLFYPDDVRDNLNQKLTMKELTILLYSFITFHGYLHHAGGASSGKYCFSIHICLVLKDVRIKEATAFAYINGINRAEKGYMHKAEAKSKKVRPDIGHSEREYFHYVIAMPILMLNT